MTRECFKVNFIHFLGDLSIGHSQTWGGDSPLSSAFDPTSSIQVLGVAGQLENQQQVLLWVLPRLLPRPFPASFLRSKGKKRTHLSPPLPLGRAEQPTCLALEMGCGPEFT